MQYVKIAAGKMIIEFHNNWLGEETVVVNGQVVSRKSSILGTDHFFQTFESGHNVQYVLRSKVDGMTMQVLLDLFRQGRLIQGNIPVRYGSKPRTPQNIAKKQGLKSLKEYDLDDALAHFRKALKMSPQDAEIHFHMACAFSVLERTREAFEALRNAVKNNLKDPEMILNHDMLAYVRMHDAFEEFLNSGFTTYDARGMQDGAGATDVGSEL